MSRIGRSLISSDDTTPPAVVAPVGILSTAQGGTGQDTSAWTGIVGVDAGVWRKNPGIILGREPSGDAGTDTSYLLDALDRAKYVSGSAELSGQFGATVLLSYGRYLVNADIVIPTSVHLRGAGKLSTVLQASGLAAGQAVVGFQAAAAGQTHSSLSHLSVSGNNLPGVIGVDFWSGTATTQNNFSTVHDAYIARCAIGCKVASPDAAKYIIYSKIKDVTFDATTLDDYVHIYCDYGVNALRILGCEFFQGATNGYALKTDSHFVGDFINFGHNTIDLGNAADGAAVYLNCANGVQALAALIHHNRMESGGVYINSIYLTAQIVHNWITDVPRCIFTKGRNVRIVDNHLWVASADQASNYDHAIEVAAGARDTYIGPNDWGIFGEITYSPTRVSDEGTGTVIEPERKNSSGRAGTHEKADMVRLPASVDGRWTELNCVTPGTINSLAAATTGTIAVGDLSHITLANATGYCRGTYITIAGVSGVRKIKHMNGSVARLTVAADTDVTDAAVALQAPVYKTTGYAVKKGTTGERPSLASFEVGSMYLDTTLHANGHPIWWNGTGWVDETGAGV